MFKRYSNSNKFFKYFGSFMFFKYIKVFLLFFRFQHIKLLDTKYFIEKKYRINYSCMIIL